MRFEAATLGALLPSLDEMEGIGVPPDPSRDPYRRVVVAVPGVGAAWAYHATRIGGRWEPIDRWADRPER